MTASQCWVGFCCTTTWISYESESHSVMSDSLRPHIVHGIFQARILEWVAFPFSRGSSQSRNWTQVSSIAGGFFTSWATREPKNTGVGSLSLLQIFPTQESNRGLLHCSWILYQLSYQRSHISPPSTLILKSAQSMLCQLGLYQLQVMSDCRLTLVI